MNVLKNIYSFYRDGFKNLTVGKTLWKIVFIKLLIIFCVLKVFIYSDNMDTRFQTDKQKSEFVYKNITKGE